MGTLTTDFFQHHFHITNGRTIDLLGGDSDSESYLHSGNSERQTLSLPVFFGSAGRGQGAARENLNGHFTTYIYVIFFIWYEIVLKAGMKAGYFSNIYIKPGLEMPKNTE